jgi:anti-sigma B factor antagonist
MNVTYEIMEDIGIIRPEGAMMVGDAESFRQSFSQWFTGTNRRFVVVDMTKVDQLDSAGLGALVAAAQQVRDKGGDLKFATLQKRPRLVFEITRSYKVFDIYNTLEEARRACR